jgi:hypothetical protein
LLQGGAIAWEAEAHVDHPDVIVVDLWEAVDDVREIACPIIIEYFHRRKIGFRRRTDDPHAIPGRRDNPRHVRPMAVVVDIRSPSGTCVVSHVDPQVMASLTEHSRDGELSSIYGGVPQRWGLIDSERRQTQAQRPVDQQLRQPSDQEGTAWKKGCRTTVACNADARQALAAFAPTWQATFLATDTVYTRPREGKRGRPARDTPPAQVVYHIDGALASSRTSRQALIAQHRCCLLATNALDHTRLPLQELLAGYKGQVQAERGCRCVKDPQF